MRYVKERRKELGGFVPTRTMVAMPVKALSLDAFSVFLKGSSGREKNPPRYKWTRVAQSRGRSIEASTSSEKWNENLLGVVPLR